MTVSQGFIDQSSNITYSGTIRLAAPMASPTMLRPTMIPQRLFVRACHNAAPMKRTSAAKMTFFLPILSARMPVIGLAMSAKRGVEDVIKLLFHAVNSCPERSEWIETRVEEMTPVLQHSISMYTYP